MISDSVTGAKNALPGVIDRALDGEEVLINWQGRVVAEMRPVLPKEAPPADKRASLNWHRAQREARPSIDVDSETYSAHSPTNNAGDLLARRERAGAACSHGGVIAGRHLPGRLTALATGQHTSAAFPHGPLQHPLPMLAFP